VPGAFGLSLAEERVGIVIGGNTTIGKFIQVFGKKKEVEA